MTSPHQTPPGRRRGAKRRREPGPAASGRPSSRASRYLRRLQQQAQLGLAYQPADVPTGQLRGLAHPRPPAAPRRPRPPAELAEGDWAGVENDSLNVDPFPDLPEFDQR
jgi:hypothetical protein